MHWPRATVAALGTLVLTGVAAGCEDEGAACEVVETRTVGLDEELVNGRSAREILDGTGPQDAQVTWRNSPDGSALTNAEAGSATSISISIASHGEQATFQRTRQTGTDEADLNCGETLAIPVSLRVVTADGALDERFETQLSYGAELPGVVWSDTSFEFNALAGWLRPARPAASGEFHVEFEGGERGWVGVVETRKNDGDAEERWEFGARWGAN